MAGDVTGAPAADAASPAHRLGRAGSWATRGARRHALFLALLALGAALRVVTQLAYQPALIFIDSTWYLEHAGDLVPGWHRPLGYPTFLEVVAADAELAVVPAVQHVLGLAMAVVIYALLVHLEVRTWLAVLATAPVLLDAYQLNIEQYVLSDTLFQFLVLGGCALLLWKRPLPIGAAAGAGLLLAAAALTRSVGLVVVVPAALALLFRRVGAARFLAFAACFAVPLATYAFVFHSVYGIYALNGWGGRLLYARVAPFVDCTKFAVPEHERVLCPTQPIGSRPTESQFVWSKRLSPVYRLEPPPGYEDKPVKVMRSEVAGAFAKRAIRNQPVAYVRAVAVDFARGFAPVKRSGRGDPPVSSWIFRLEYPRFRPAANAAVGARVDRDLAAFLRSYQRFAYTPGPVMAVGLLVAFAAAAGIGRARRSPLRSSAFLFGGTAFVLTAAPVMVVLFSWRYQLPQLVLVPPALALGLTAFLAKPREDEVQAGAAQEGRRRRFAFRGGTRAHESRSPT